MCGFCQGLRKDSLSPVVRSPSQVKRIPQCKKIICAGYKKLGNLCDCKDNAIMSKEEFEQTSDRGADSI